VAAEIGPTSDPTSRVIRFTVIAPTLGRDDRLLPLLNALEAQVFPRARWDLVIACDGTTLSAATERRLQGMRARVASAALRQGPGAARNRGARGAESDYLAFTEDDCAPAPDWLAAAAARLEQDRGIDVLEGSTLLPDGRPVRRRHDDGLTWLPTNLFVRRDFFDRVGGYCEGFFDARRGLYFREDSDFGFTARKAGARVLYDPAPRVVHPREHEGWLDPIRWAQRYEMDPLLASRHPREFLEEIEVVRWGPLQLRRPFVRICGGYVVALLAALAALSIGEAGVAAWFAGLAVALLLAIWSKWHFDLRRIPVLPIVPIVLLAALVRGRGRAMSFERQARARSG